MWWIKRYQRQKLLSFSYIFSKKTSSWTHELLNVLNWLIYAEFIAKLLISCLKVVKSWQHPIFLSEIKSFLEKKIFLVKMVFNIGNFCLKVVKNDLKRVTEVCSDWTSTMLWKNSGVLTKMKVVFTLLLSIVEHCVNLVAEAIFDKNKCNLINETMKSKYSTTLSEKKVMPFNLWARFGLILWTTLLGSDGLKKQSQKNFLDISFKFGSK